jgi:hypothetical protein
MAARLTTYAPCFSVPPGKSLAKGIQLRSIVGASERTGPQHLRRASLFSSKTLSCIFRINDHTDMFGAGIHGTFNDRM